MPEAVLSLARKAAFGPQVLTGEEGAQALAALAAEEARLWEALPPARRFLLRWVLALL